jgi:hypothetical protein
MIFVSAIPAAILMRHPLFVAAVSSPPDFAQETAHQKHGNLPLRRALYLPALVAVMRKLLHAIFGVFKHQTAFDGNKLYPLA